MRLSCDTHERSGQKKERLQRAFLQFNINTFFIIITMKES